MSPDNWLVLAILIASVFVFITDRFRVDFVALCVLVALVLSGLLTAQEAFEGFASPAVVTVWAVFIISGALFRSGVADYLAQSMLQLAGQSQLRLLVLMMVTAGVMSAFMNNIGAVAILLPAVITVSRKLAIPPSKLLIPLAFAALLGGNMTLIGTPPNILAASILEEYGELPAFQFFDFLPTGIIVLVMGILYMTLVGRHLLPDRSQPEPLSRKYPVRQYLSQMRVRPGSPLIGKQINETRLASKYDLNIVRVRHGSALEDSATEHRISVGDVMLIMGQSNALVQVGREQGLAPDTAWDQSEWHLEEEEDADDLHLTEVMLAPRSHVQGQTLRELNFRNQFGVSVLAIQHRDEAITDHLGDVELEYGDAMLVQGTPDRIMMLQANPDYLVLETSPISMRRTKKAPLAIMIGLLILFVITLGWLHVSVAMLLGALLMIGTGVVTMEEAYEAIDWKSVFLIAGMLPLGIAMEQTGTARILADRLIEALGGGGTYVMLATIFLLTALLTEVISNAAATVLMVPIAIDTAFGLQVAPQSFVMATVIAASTSFLMPIGHQVNVIIYAPGGYKFHDYARVGLGLNLLLVISMTLLLPIIWPFYS